MTQHRSSILAVIGHEPDGIHVNVPPGCGPSVVTYSFVWRNRRSLICSYSTALYTLWIFMYLPQIFLFIHLLINVFLSLFTTTHPRTFHHISGLPKCPITGANILAVLGPKTWCKHALRDTEVKREFKEFGQSRFKAPAYESVA